MRLLNVFQQDDAFLWKLMEQVPETLVAEANNVDNVYVQLALTGNRCGEAGLASAWRAIVQITPTVYHVSMPRRHLISVGPMPKDNVPCSQCVIALVSWIWRLLWHPAS